MDEITSQDIENVIIQAKKFIEDNNFEELHNNILHNKDFDNFRKIYDDDYVHIIYYIIIEYGNTVRVQSGGCPPCIAFIARILGKKVITTVAKKGIQKGVKKGVQKGVKKTSKKQAKKYAKTTSKKRAKKYRRKIHERMEQSSDDDEDETVKRWFR
jgi:hypothetical protein